jgi:enoyl-CoA hydratase
MTVAHEQWGLEENDAMRNEMRHGLQTLNSGESEAGATAFTEGARRHGSERGEGRS